MAFLTGYGYRKAITIDHLLVDETLTDFPILVKLTSITFDFSKARSDGYDIRFTASDGETLLKYERERHDAVNSLAEYWVKVPSISNTTDTIIYIYYGDADAIDGADPTNVWDSNFKMVQHMKDDPDTSHIQDSTINNNDGTKPRANEPIEADAKIAKGQDFDGVDDQITISDSASLDITSQITLEAWYYSKNRGNWETIFSKGVGYPNDLYGFYYESGGADKMTGVLNFTTAGRKTAESPQFFEDGLHYVVLTYGGTDMKLYIDCTLKVTTNIGSDTIKTDNNSLLIGNRADNILAKGTIDEVRISNIARSAAWIKASYNSENDSLVSYGSEEEGIDRKMIKSIFRTNFSNQIRRIH